MQQGEEVKEQIHTHDQVQRSERLLLQQVDTVVQRKRHVLAKQREEVERVHTQFKDCQEMVQTSLEEWSQLQVMMEKENMLHRMRTVSLHINPIAHQPVEEADIKFTQNNIISDEIGEVKSSATNVRASLLRMPCSPNTPSTAILMLHSHDFSPVSLPLSLISCMLFSPGDSQPKECDIIHTTQAGYNINYTPLTTKDQLIVQVGGVDISGSPFTLLVIPSSVMESKPVRTITDLNSPWGIAVCDNGDIVVTEYYDGRVSIVNKEGKKVTSFGTIGTKEGQFLYPRGVAISNDGHIFSN